MDYSELSDSQKKRKPSFFSSSSRKKEDKERINQLSALQKGRRGAITDKEKEIIHRLRRTRSMSKSTSSQVRQYIRFMYALESKPAAAHLA